jgi:putative sigma-54 modulation protein
MEFKITGRNVEITPPISEYADRKTQRLHRFYDRIQSVTVLVERTNPTFHVEIIVDIEGGEDIIAKGHKEDLYAGIDETVDKAERQLHDLKEKRRNRKH